MKKTIISFLCTVSLFSNESIELQSDFNNLLEELTSIATHSKVNIDYLPSVVNVVSNTKIENSGAKNLLEVLNLVSGVDISMTSIGWKYPIMRGQKSSTFSGHDKIKLLIDGIAISNKTSGAINFFMEFPVELIERVEVLKGAGSAVYGNGALSGVINVITKISKKTLSPQVAFSIGNKNYVNSSLIMPTNDNGFYLAIDGYVTNEKSGTQTQKVNFQSFPVSVNGKESDNELKDTSLGLHWQYKDLKVMGRYLKHKTGNYFGIIEAIESKDDMKQMDELFFTEAEYTHRFLEKEFTLKAGFKNYNNDYKYRAIPKEIYGFAFQQNFSEDVIMGNKIKEQSEYINIESQLYKDSKNTFLMGAFQESAKALSNSSFANPMIDANIIEYKDGYIGKDRKRDTSSLYMEEIYSFNDSVSIALNARVDNYNIYGEQYSYRGGISYVKDNEIYKLSLAKSHRVPTWFEQYGSILIAQISPNTNILKVEKEQVLEVGYTYKFSINNKFSVNGYLMEIEDPIDFETVFLGNTVDGIPINGVQSANLEKRKAKGIDLDIEYEVNDNNKISFSGSYVSISGDGNSYLNYASHAKLVAEYLGKLSYLYKKDKIVLSTNVLYRSNISNSSNNLLETNTNVSSFLTVNPMIKYNFTNNLVGKLDIDNLFNEDVAVSHTNDGVFSKIGGIPYGEKGYRVSFIYKF